MYFIIYMRQFDVTMWNAQIKFGIVSATNELTAMEKCGCIAPWIVPFREHKSAIL